MAKLFRITTVPISVEKLLGNQLTYMNEFFEVTAISSPDNGSLQRVGEKLQIKTYSLEMTRQITPIKDLQSLWLMYKYLKKEKPEIVHTHTPKAGLIGMMAAKLAGVKIRLHTVAGLPLMETSGFKRKVLNQVEKLTYNCATNVYPNSKGLYNFILEEKLGKTNKLKVIGNGSTNGIDVSYFDPSLFSEEATLNLKNKLSISNDDFVFVFVGRLVKDKGINELISAFKKLSAQNVKLLLVGPYESDLDPLEESTLSEINHNKNIITVGFQKDVRPYFAISDALVFPSYREGFPNVVLQSLAMGLPAIVSDINGCNEIITNQENGVIVPPKSESSILEAILLLLDQTLYNKLQSNARTSIMKYRQEHIWELLKENYEQLLISKNLTF